MAGLTLTGFLTKSLEEILAEIQTAEKGKFGESFDVSADSPAGQLNGVMADRVAELWEVLAALYSAMNPNSATGQALRNIGAMSGIAPLAATKSTAQVIACGTNGTLLPAGRVVSVTGTGSRFASTADATITTRAAWSASTAFTLGTLRTNGGNMYYCTSGGVSASSGGPSGTGSAIADGTATWRFVAASTSAVFVDVAAENFGPTIAAAWTLTTIETPVGGWSSVVNPLDANLGTNTEKDAEFRARRVALLRAAGAGALEAIRSDVLQVAGVTACTTLENTGDVVNVDGLPPHSFECIVLGGDDAAVAQAIFDSKPAGIATYGSLPFVVVDTLGGTHTVNLTRPADVAVYVTVDLVADGDFPTLGVDLVKAALVAYGDSLLVGADVVRSQLFAPVDSVPGVYDITNIRLGFSASPAGTANLTIGTREKAAFDTSRIVVNVT